MIKKKYNKAYPIVGTVGLSEGGVLPSIMFSGWRHGWHTRQSLDVWNAEEVK